jgi:hypothetical protein
MGIAYEMKKLTRDIASSHKDRTKNIHQIGEEVKRTRVHARNLVHGFKSSRQETSRQLIRDLARDKTGRTSEVKAILKDSQVFLKDFKDSQKITNARLRKDLSAGTAKRLSEVQMTLEDVHKLIRRFHSSLQEVSYQLKKDLGENRAEVKSEVEKLIGDAQNLVTDFHTARKQAGGQLREGMAQDRAHLGSEVKQMRSDFREAGGSLRADLKEVRDAWQGLAAMIQTRMGVTARPPAAILPEAKAPAAKQGNSDLETKLLATVNGYPAGGISLADLSGILRVAPVVLGRASKGLINKRTIRKKGKLYFPVSSGN